MRQNYKSYSLLTNEIFQMVRESLIQEFKTPNHVSRNWLIERLSQCVCYIEGVENDH